MENKNFETVSQAMNYWNQKGFTESFQAEKDEVKATFSGVSLHPSEIEVLETYRFDGMTNPSDDVELIVAESENGIKGTFLVSHSSEHNQDEDTIRLLQTK